MKQVKLFKGDQLFDLRLEAKAFLFFGHVFLLQGLLQTDCLLIRVVARRANGQHIVIDIGCQDFAIPFLDRRHASKRVMASE